MAIYSPAATGACMLTPHGMAESISPKTCEFLVYVLSKLLDREEVDLLAQTNTPHTAVMFTRNQVLEGHHMTIEMAGNVVPVTKSGDQLQICFHAFHESRLPFSVRVRDVTQPSIARMSFVSESRTLKSDITGAMGCRTSVCTLTVQLPDELHAESHVDLQTVVDHSPRATSSAHCLHDNCTRNIFTFVPDNTMPLYCCYRSI